MFCEKCGSLMSPIGGKYICSSCGHEVNKKSVAKSDRIVSKSSGKEVILVKEEKSAEPLDSDAVCPKCHHSGAYYLLKQTYLNWNNIYCHFQNTKPGSTMVNQLN